MTVFASNKQKTATTSGEPSRVISVSSGGMLVIYSIEPLHWNQTHELFQHQQSQKMNVDDPNLDEKPWDGVKAYAQTKVFQTTPLINIC